MKMGCAGSMQVGLQPDKLCKPEQVLTSYWSSGEQDGASLQEDPCVTLAKDLLLQQ